MLEWFYKQGSNQSITSPLYFDVLCLTVLRLWFGSTPHVTGTVREQTERKEGQKVIKRIREEMSRGNNVFL